MTLSEFEVRPWTPQEDQFLADNYPNHGVVYCAVQLGRSGAAVRSRCRHIGVRQRQTSQPYTPDEDEYLEANFGKRRAADLAEVLGRKEASVRHRARILGLVNKKL